jgi:hypothetical protein
MSSHSWYDRYVDGVPYPILFMQKAVYARLASLFHSMMLSITSMYSFIFSIMTRVCPVDVPSPLRWKPSVLWLSDDALLLMVVCVSVDWETSYIPLCVSLGIINDASPPSI